MTDQRIEELAALSLGMEGLSHLHHTGHSGEESIKTCQCQYAKAFRILTKMRHEDISNA